ncbi:hypothetical protein RO21_02115 [[Actinobacillus] muris]|uniref:Uncharacterized protein n=1 Tax=Muribacter muris TaxID=67855 RepID=A0A0J5P9J2_9PAST|nr:hypothetical protein [Muribacter muris]KMK52209.1 hypothetical protein RO21_02115 [[Actinobacillus] muris] [Muribacter muris]
MKSEKYIALSSMISALLIPIVHFFYYLSDNGGVYINLYSWNDAVLLLSITVLLSLPVLFSCLIYLGINWNAITGSALTILAIYLGGYLFIIILYEDRSVDILLPYYLISSSGAFIMSSIGYALLKQEYIKKPFWVIVLSSGLTLFGFGLPFLLMVL